MQQRNVARGMAVIGSSRAITQCLKCNCYNHTVFDGGAWRNVLVMCFSQDLVDALLRDMIVCVVCARVRALCVTL